MTEKAQGELVSETAQVVERTQAPPVTSSDDVKEVEVTKSLDKEQVTASDVQVYETERAAIELERLRDELRKRRLVLYSTIGMIGLTVVFSFIILLVSKDDSARQFATHSLSMVLGLAAASLWPSSKSDGS